MTNDDRRLISDQELQQRIREALSNKANGVQIDGSALARIRDRTQRRTTHRRWRPIAVGFAAAAVIIGAAIVPRLINHDAPPAAASSAVATAGKTAPSTSAAALPSGAALPIAASTKTLYPVSDTAIAAEAITKGETSKYSLNDDPAATALAFCKVIVPIITQSSTIELSTGDVVLSKNDVPGTAGVLVPIYTTSNGVLLTNVFLRYVQVNGVRAWLVVGASLPAATRTHHSLWMHPNGRPPKFQLLENYAAH